MSPERAQAYGRVARTLKDLGQVTLEAGEEDQIRWAADQLIFSNDLGRDVAAHNALQDAVQLCRALVEDGRWESSTATRVASDLCNCGPGRPAELKAA
jgi:hypothetical protein